MSINEFNSASGLVGISYPSLVKTEILLWPEESFQEVLERTQWVKFESNVGGIFVADSALVKYVDAITVKNWGFAPKNKIIRKAP